MLDLDGFKQVNDRFGHLEGNKVLHAVAAGLKDRCREYDYVARMGGDEFVVLLPGVKPTDVEAKIVQFRDSWRPGLPGVVPRGASDGQHRRGAFPGRRHRREQLLAEADRRMYKEKRTHKPSFQGVAAVASDAEWVATVH